MKIDFAKNSNKLGLVLTFDTGRKVRLNYLESVELSNKFSQVKFAAKLEAIPKLVFDLLKIKELEKLK